MNRPIAILLLASLAGISACSGARPRNDEDAPSVCVYPADGEKYTKENAELFVKYTRQCCLPDVRLTESLKDSRECDLAVRLTWEGAWNPVNLDAYLPHGKKKVWSSTTRWGLPWSMKTGHQKYSRELAEALKNPALRSGIEKDREARSLAATPRPASDGLSKEAVKELIQELKASQPQAVPAKPAAPVSDVDKPLYRSPERPQDFAVVVGIERYSDLPPASWAERDAEAVTAHLLASGYPSRNVVTLTGEKASHTGMAKFLESWLPRNVTPESRVLFYFSGHGSPDVKSGQAYLLPWDGDPNFLENTAYPVSRLYEKLASLKAREVVVVMDACFSGAGGRSVLASGARPLVAQVRAGVVPEKVTVLAAAAADEITGALDDQGHGLFTYYFLKGIAKEGSSPPQAKGLYEYLKPRVQDAARRQNREQTPALMGRSIDGLTIP